MAEFAFENRIWDKAETISRDELQALQLHRLRECLARVSNATFYKQHFAQDEIAPPAVKSLDDLRQLPFTTKDDFRQNYPLGLLVTPREQIVRIHGSSGTTGKLIFVAYTAEDLITWANLCARFLVAGGLQPHHLVHIAFGYGLFTGGLGFHYGGERVGATVIPTSTGNTKRQLMLIQDISTSVLTCTPSYTLILAEGAKEIGLDLRTTKLRLAVCGAEPWSEQMRTDIEARLPLKAMDIYGLTEIVGKNLGRW